VLSEQAMAVRIKGWQVWEALGYRKRPQWMVIPPGFENDRKHTLIFSDTLEMAFFLRLARKMKKPYDFRKLNRLYLHIRKT
jgi:hypothetical protein